MGWRQKINKHRRKLSQKALSKAFNKLSSCVFLAIDPQKHFCDPIYNPRRGTEKTDALCTEINKAAQEFRRRSLSICWVYSDKFSQGPNGSFGGWHNVSPHEKDLIAGKHGNSAFEHPFDVHIQGGGPLGAMLAQNNKKHLLVAGFNLAACVEDTVKSALAHGYNVFVIEDLCGNDAFSAAHHSLLDFKQDMLRYCSRLEKIADEAQSSKKTPPLNEPPTIPPTPAPYIPSRPFGALHYTTTEAISKALVCARR